MKSNSSLNLWSVFRQFAGADLSVWENINGYEVSNKVYGVGQIRGISKSENGKSIYFEVEFDNLPANMRLKKFDHTSFDEGHLKLYFNFSLIPGFCDFYKMKEEEEKEHLIQEEIKARLFKEQEEQVRREAKFSEEYIQLKKKYGIYELLFKSITSPLYKILLKLESRESLDENEIAWLYSQDLYHIKQLHILLALHYQREYTKTGDLWNLVKASSSLRRADNPVNAKLVKSVNGWSTEGEY